jgi:hypothetical protein
MQKIYNFFKDHPYLKHFFGKHLNNDDQMAALAVILKNLFLFKLRK